ncbi:hypothetical protein K438DRAFT_2127529 [Mycena galopus ATCC 62051]|nr:hypothetical protein K438DRAFT_2127529 [Mycena galopus ATCC 62051]
MTPPVTVSANRTSYQCRPYERKACFMNLSREPLHRQRKNLQVSAMARSVLKSSRVKITETNSAGRRWMGYFPTSALPCTVTANRKRRRLERMGGDEVAAAAQTGLDPSQSSTEISIGNAVKSGSYRRDYGMYRQLEVQITGKHALKGVRGAILDVYDSAERRLRTQMGSVADRNGLLFTVQEKYSNHSIARIPIENLLLESTMQLLMEAHFLPADALHTGANQGDSSLPRGSFPAQLQERPQTPPLSSSETQDIEKAILTGEHNGEWLSQPHFAGKRLDVRVIGVSVLRTKISDAMAALEGKCGWLLLEGSAYTTAKKITIYGVGNGGVKHAVDRTCIRPKGEDNSGEKFMDATQRVIVVDPDVFERTAEIGEYAQTMPAEKYALSTDIIFVQFETGARGLFPTASLCSAHNIPITLTSRQFPATIFPGVHEVPEPIRGEQQILLDLFANEGVLSNQNLFPTASLCAAHNIPLSRPEIEFPATMFSET